MFTPFRPRFSLPYLSLCCTQTSVPGDEAKFYLKLSDEEAQLITPNRDTGRTFNPTNETGNATFIRRALISPTRQMGQAEQQLTALQAELESVQASTGDSFEHKQRLDFLKQRIKELEP
jgi:hypothetical protein